MKKVTAFLAALVLCLGTICGLHVFVNNHTRFDTHEFGSWISQYKFFAADRIKANMDENSILVLGSSEFRHGKKMSSHPVNLFKNNALNMIMVGAGYYQSLFHAVELAAVEEGMQNRKVVLILSPQWFKSEGVLAPAYASRFSEANYIAMLRNKRISKDTKDYILKRSKTLLVGDKATLQRVKKYEKVFLKGNATFSEKQYVRFYRKFLEEKSKISIFAAAKAKAIHKYNPKKKGKEMEPEWTVYEELAEKEGEKAAKGNPFYVSDKVYKKQLLPVLEKKKGSQAGQCYSKSPEYRDLECFLQLCKETGVQPMLVMMPFNGYWYDHTGLPKEERQRYYENIRGMSAAYGAELADFGDEEYTKYFFLDQVHLGWKGWLRVNESIYRFASKNEKK
ncbi:MAG: D-alanyl-lipoteichoic acid biosynthesis protein DltD [Firmicutes bacterium]|nr:D-alanyl-lipoteichoic acid biosynthesis protein DltD [Bacillota bacterium]NBI63606.1 D-alanyl-lipoteichoic acid biosynthesis protein DltD [Clostridiales bacterium]